MGSGNKTAFPCYNAPMNAPEPNPYEAPREVNESNVWLWRRWWSRSRHQLLAYAFIALIVIILISWGLVFYYSVATR
jgi:hypothetical protein